MYGGRDNTTSATKSGFEFHHRKRAMTSIVMDTGTHRRTERHRSGRQNLEHGGDIGSDRSAYGIPRPDARPRSATEELIVNAAAPARRSVRRDGNASQTDRGENRRTRHEAPDAVLSAISAGSSISR